MLWGGGGAVGGGGGAVPPMQLDLKMELNSSILRVRGRSKVMRINKMYMEHEKYTGLYLLLH